MFKLLVSSSCVMVRFGVNIENVTFPGRGTFLLDLYTSWTLPYFSAKLCTFKEQTITISSKVASMKTKKIKRCLRCFSAFPYMGAFISDAQLKSV